MHINIVTLFPTLFPGPLAHSITGRALEKNLWSLQTTDIRKYGLGKHQSVDDTPYGGGAGMVMRPDVVAAALRQAKQTTPKAKTIYLTPTGQPFTQTIAKELATEPNLILLCGHYEGIDQRVIDTEVDLELSLGPYVLTGGEIAAYPMIDAILRHVPGVLGTKDSLHEESFDLKDEHGNPLLEYPHYTRPADWEGHQVPQVLTSGNHGEIEKWRHEQAKKRTKNRE